RVFRSALPLALTALLAACVGVPPQRQQAPLVLAPPTPTTAPPAAIAAPATAAPAPAEDLWDKLRSSFAMSDCNADPAVLDMAKHYTRNPKWFEEHLQSVLPRLVYVQQVAAQYDVAGEFVLLPWVESHYRPVAASKRHPAGMWQIMPVTAGSMGLRVDHRYDGRLDMPAATTAVMKLLERYHDQFHDWRVVDYAYNSGEFNVRKLVQEHGLPADEPVIPAWRVRRATREHLVKLLAIACVIREPERFQVSLPVLPDTEQLVPTPISSSITITKAADKAGMSLAAFKHLNPAFGGNTIEASAVSYLMLPAGHVEQFRAASREASNEATAASSNTTSAAARSRHRTHVVNRGESLWQIAREYSTNVARLQQLNHLQDDAIQPGEVLQLDDLD
ncbi:MAG: transglycosylase SLT domain-containing protein, partial [Rhodanobacter sp.]